jgi:hypothetical protein
MNTVKLDRDSKEQMSINPVLTRGLQVTSKECPGLTLNTQYIS